MRILHTLHWVQFAGTEKVCVDLCNQISKKNEIFLLSNKKIAPYLENSVNLVEFDFERSRYNPIFLYQTAKLLERISPDIIHCHNTKEIEIMHYARFFLKKKPKIVGTRHNPILKNKFSYADLGVAVSAETMNVMNAKKNILITNGVGYKEPVRLKTGNKFQIVAVGRLAKVKGFDVLIEALSEAKFDFCLKIVGEGEKKNELDALIKRLNLEDKVELIGFVKNVNDYLYSANLQVISSHEEGLSLALIEGVFYSKLILASDIANHEEIVGKELVFNISSENRVLNLRDKLNEIYDNYDKFIEIFAKVKAKKGDFSIEKMAEKYTEVYKSLL